MELVPLQTGHCVLQVSRLSNALGKHRCFGTRQAVRCEMSHLCACLKRTPDLSFPKHGPRVCRHRDVAHGIRRKQPKVHASRQLTWHNLRPGTLGGRAGRIPPLSSLHRCLGRCSSPAECCKHPSEKFQFEDRGPRPSSCRAPERNVSRVADRGTPLTHSSGRSRSPPLPMALVHADT